MLNWGLKFRTLYETLTIFNDFSPGNHGHGGHEHGVCRGFSEGVSSHLRWCPQGVASVLCKKTPVFGSRRSKLDHLTIRFWLLSSALQGGRTWDCLKQEVRRFDPIVDGTPPNILSLDSSHFLDCLVAPFRNMIIAQNGWNKRSKCFLILVSLKIFT